MAYGLQQALIQSVSGAYNTITYAELLYQDTLRFAMSVTSATVNTVVSATGNTIVASGNINSYFVNGFISFLLPDGNSLDIDDLNAYQITNINGNTITLANNLTAANKVLGNVICFTRNLSGVATSFTVNQCTTSGIGIANGKITNLGTLTPVNPTNNVNLSTYVSITSAINGLIQVSLPTSAFTVVPPANDNPGGVTPIIYSGSLKWTFPQVAQNPIEVKSQRFAFLVYSNLSTLPTPL